MYVVIYMWNILEWVEPNSGIKSYTNDRSARHRFEPVLPSTRI